MMIIAKNFTEVRVHQKENSSKDALFLCSNSEIDTALLIQIIRCGEWNKLNSINGFFAGIYQKDDKVYLFCDRLGIYPLFYYLANANVYASPLICGILDALQYRPKHNFEGVISLLLFGHHLADETVFEGIRRCKGGETVIINNTGVVEDKIIWREKHIYQDRTSAEPNDLAELFVKGLEENIPADGKIILPFSGGFDSRAVFGAALECVSADRIHTLTFGGKDCFDSQIAMFVAKKAGVKHTLFPITEQIFSDNFMRSRAANYAYGYSAFATQPPEMISYLSAENSNHSVSFWGVGGDAIAGSHLLAADISLENCSNSEDFARLLIRKRCFVPLTTVCEITSLNESEIVSITADLISSSGLHPYEKSWQFLDAWDIFVRGRMELISVLPFDKLHWECPHLGRNYFNQMATQCFNAKLNQNMYRHMLSNRFKFLFSLPTRRLKGKSLAGSQWPNLYWIMRWRKGKIIQALRETASQRVDGIGRNYGKNENFFNTPQGKDKLLGSIQLLSQQRVIKKNSEAIDDIATKNTQVALMLITLGYGFEKPA